MTSRIVKIHIEYGIAIDRLWGLHSPSREQDRKVDLGGVEQTGERKLSLQTPDGELHDLDPVCPQPEAADPSDKAGHCTVGVYRKVAGYHVGYAGDAAGGGTLQRGIKIAERRVAVFDGGICVCGDVGGRHCLHQAPTDIGWSGALPHTPLEPERVAAVICAVQDRIEAKGRQRFWRAIEGEGGPHM